MKRRDLAKERSEFSSASSGQLHDGFISTSYIKREVNLFFFLWFWSIGVVRLRVPNCFTLCLFNEVGQAHTEASVLAHSRCGQCPLERHDCVTVQVP